ncbi:4Fe-4S dicluster protein [Hypnocyclicus thermotrophus]|uniref:4Fe-4S dicluster protein n=1 Tax=Hypnocyclicus thermotrophus TaxID=1627895 RepID=A0AA46I6J9_9FUSO|nr:4Fe-4S binding protein [Hypnocyclicus thermotrophus]TDT72432.1 4Fe-4S dicluster protein [Hypnocyclicus thermotrophus]
MYIIDEHTCIECGFCQKICPKEAIEKTEIAYKITGKCVSCGLCVKKCPVDAISK